ncbi:MAG: TetR/AcrR family transcriptional regulator [bacterium]|nr:TetR/AcrR family transcriptional regulator [bacterium]MCP4964785.1 TetR/AcrR family transcriptional regulator [bacterium]
MKAADRIVHATLGLILEHGISGITMSAIAREAEVARQTLYNHYPDVESIVTAAMETHQRESLDTLTELMRTINSPAGRLEHLVRHAAAVAAHGHPTFRYGFSARHQKLVAEYDHGVRSLVAAALTDGIASGAFRADLDLRRDPLLVQRMINATGELVGDDPEDAAAAVAVTVHTVLAAVASP